MANLIKWTEESIRAEARKYSTKNEFRHGSGSAYLAMIKRFPNLSNDIFGVISAFKIKWTEEALRELAANHETAGALKKANPSAYVMLKRRFPGLIDQLFVITPVKRPISEAQREAIARRVLRPENRKWNETALRAEAAKYSSKVEFSKGSYTAYSAMLKHHPDLIDELFENQGPANKFWTEALLRAEATKYATKVDFGNQNASAYGTTLKRFPHLLDEIFVNQLQSWDKQKLLDEAAQYLTKREFQSKGGSAYVLMLRRFPGLIDDLFENQHESWDESKLRELALKYTSKVEFKTANSSAYASMRKRFNHLLEELFTNQLQTWDEQKLRVEVAKYRTKADLRRGNSAAYARLLTRFSDRIDEFCSHMEAGFRASDDDAIYVWKADRALYNGKPVYKIGVTSERTGTQRIMTVAGDSGFTAKIIIIRSVVSASKLESKLHAIGDNPQYVGFNGCTEFRALNDDELELVVTMIEDATYSIEPVLNNFVLRCDDTNLQFVQN